LLFVTNATLTLEGLELHDAPTVDDNHKRVIHLKGAVLRAANCRFRSGIWTNSTPGCVFVNCEFLSDVTGEFIGNYTPGARFTFENCLHRGGGAALYFHSAGSASDEMSVQIKRSTFVNKRVSVWLAVKSPPAAKSDQPPASKPVRLEVSGCIFDTPSVLGFEQHKDFVAKAGVHAPAAAKALLLRLMQWRGERNVLPAGSTSVNWGIEGRKQPAFGPTSLDEWQRFWGGAEADPREGRLLFQDSSLRTRTEGSLDQVTPEDFRLHPDSAGYRAGKDGNDLGADVALVGPGQAYEDWRKTPEYQVWLKDSGQLKDRAAAKSESRAFVVQGGAGIAERKFNTLAAAVQAASDGDTIEIRGNGPFITKPISINDRALVIRAGAGFWPVIQADPDEPATNLLQSNSHLVLEGLDVRWVEATPFNPADPRYLHLVVVGEPTARLDAVNCRFLMNRRAGPHTMSCLWGALRHLRNCQIVVGGHGALDNVGDIAGKPNTTVMVDNCLMIGMGLTPHLTQAEPTKLVLNHNTVLGPHFVTLYLVNQIDPLGGGQDSKPLQIAASANILAGRMSFVQALEFLEQGKILSAKDAERLLPQLVGWQDDQNLYSSPADGDLLGQFAHMEPIPSTTQITTLPAWKDFWGLEEIDSQRGYARFQGGDLVAKAMSKPELVVPEDFRLREGSPGYRAGPDGKDLGADVDLVGPGRAYEDWKKTPEYLQWLKDTKQVARTQSARPEPDAAARELAKWQGEWENAEYGRLVIHGERWSSHPKDGFEVVSTIKIVEVTDAMTHLLLLSAGVDGKVRTIQTILRVDGDTLHNCGTFGSVRPAEFTNKPGCIYTQWNRVTKQLTGAQAARPEPEGTAQELAKWQGEWENADYGKLVIDGERWASYPKDGFEVVSTIKIVEATDEMTHVLLHSAGVDGKVRTIQTILRVDGDTLHNCGTIGSVRPSEFANKPGCIYTQWKRVSSPPP